MRLDQRAALKARAEAVAISPLPSPLGIAATAQQARDMLALLAALETAEQERDTLKAALGSDRPTFQSFWEACLRLIEDPHGRTMIRYAAAVEEELKAARAEVARLRGEEGSEQ